MICEKSLRNGDGLVFGLPPYGISGPLLRSFVHFPLCCRWKGFLQEGCVMAKGFNPMQQVKALQDKMAKVQEELASKTVESAAGGGMVTAVFNGRQELLNLKIDQQVINPEDVEMLEDLVVAAVNDGIRRSQEMAAAEMSKLAGGLNIPGLKIPGLF